MSDTLEIIYKVCRACNTPKTLDCFHTVLRGKYGVAAKCKDCVNLDARERYKNNPDHRKAIMRKSHMKNPTARRNVLLKHCYGISLREYNELLLKQDYKCVTCGITQFAIGRDLDVDHCHQTSKVRGLLCNPCNLALGLVKDNVEILRDMIKYLEDSR